MRVHRAPTRLCDELLRVVASLRVLGLLRRTKIDSFFIAGPHHRLRWATSIGCRNHRALRLWTQLWNCHRWVLHHNVGDAAAEAAAAGTMLHSGAVERRNLLAWTQMCVPPFMWNYCNTHIVV